MYESGMESLKKAALSVKVRSFLSGQVGVGGGDLDHLVDNPELSLDLQSLIDDPNFSEVSDGLFPDLLQQHDKQGVSVNGKGLDPNYNSVNNSMRSSLGHYTNQRNPLAYMPQPVHGGSSFTPGSNASSPGSSPIQGDHHHQQQNPHHHNSNGHHHHHHNNGHHVISVSGSGGVKSEPSETNPNNGGRLDFNANTVSSSSDPGYSSYSSNNLTSPSSSSSSSSSSSTTSSTGGGGGGGGGQSSANNNNNNNNYPGSYGLDGHNALAQHLSSHSHLHGAMMKNGGGGGGGGSLTFNPLKGLSSHHHSHHGSSSGGLSKKLKNVDKASDEYKRRRERNNIAVRKSREKAKMRSRETEERVKILAKENERLQKKIDLLTEELTFLRSFFSNVGGLPEQIHREFNKHLETFQHHHIQNGIQFPSFASFKSMQ